MNVSVRWLRALAPELEGSADELAARLSLRAVPVDRVVPVGEGLDDLLVARVASVRPHPNADRLTLCRVDVGRGELVDVVCGAPNVEEGALYPYVPPGGTLPGGFRIESREIRGRTSHGMLCSEAELGLGRDAGGILRLSSEQAPGRRLAEAMDLPDARLELDLTPNRIDLACHLGVARELAPGGVAGVSLPPFGGPGWEPEWVAGEESARAAGVTVAIEDPERCFRYLAAVVRGVSVGPSPEWLRSRLRGAGARPINNVVDATNYVLLELNQPLHAFDLARIGGAEVRVRGAREGEGLMTLDGEKRELHAAVTAIADAERPIALAGVMGGEESEVSQGTEDVLLECAWFDPGHTRRTARATGLATEASYRFERGIDASGMEEAVRRCVELILTVAGGKAERKALWVGRPRSEPRTVALRPARVRRLLGLRLDGPRTSDLLRPLGFEPTAGTETGAEPDRPVMFRVPGWRGDVTREVDLMEEVARAYGYEKFPDEERRFRPSGVPDDALWRRLDRIRRTCVELGLLEARGVPFAAEERTEGEAVALRRPLSHDEGVLRTGLVPGLARRVEHNWSRGRRDVRLFELGSVFARRETTGGSADGGEEARDGPRRPFAEEMRAALVLSGRRHPAHWSGPDPDADVWDLKGAVAELVERLGLGSVEPGAAPVADAGDPPLTHGWLGVERLWIRGRDGVPVGVAGRVRAGELDAPPWAAPVWAAEFRVAAVRLDRAVEYRPLPGYPAVGRDLAFSTAREVDAGELERRIRASAPPTLEDLRLFDVYTGEGIEEDRRSLAWRLVFRAEDRTLTDDEVDEAVSRIVRDLEEAFDARIRSS